MALPVVAIVDGADAPQNIYGINSGRQAAADSQAVALDSEALAVLTDIEGDTDSIIALIGSTNTKLDSVISALNTLDGRVDGVESLLTTANAAIKNEDAVHASGDAGRLVLAVRKDTAASTAGTDGDYTALTTNNVGELRVDVTDLTSNTSDANVSLASMDGKLTTVIGHVDGLETLITTLNGKIDTLNGYASDTATIGVAQDTAVLKNAATSLTPKFAVISASSSGDNTLVAAVTSKKIRVLAYSLMGAGAVNARFQSAAAGDYLTGLKYIAAAGGGICQPYNPLGWFETDAGELLNLELSGAVAVGGELVYVEV